MPQQQQLSRKDSARAVAAKQRALDAHEAEQAAWRRGDVQHARRLAAVTRAIVEALEAIDASLEENEV